MLAQTTIKVIGFVFTLGIGGVIGYAIGFARKVEVMHARIVDLEAKLKPLVNLAQCEAKHMDPRQAILDRPPLRCIKTVGHSDKHEDVWGWEWE